MGFKPITVGLSIDDSLFKDMHLVAKDPLKLNNAINTCLINLNIYIMLFKYALNIYEDHRHISIIYNHFHNILILFDVLPNFPFTTSETMRDYYL